MGEVVDLESYRAAKRRRQREGAKPKERARPLTERSESSNTKPDRDPLEEDPA